MSKNVFLLILGTFLISNGFAQIKTIDLEDVTQIYTFGQEVKFLEDKSRTIRFEDLQKPEIAQKFQKSTQNTLNFGYSKSDYWLRFKVKSPHIVNNEWVLNIKNSFIDTLNIYQLQNDSLVYAYQTGDTFSFSQRVAGYRYFVFPLRLSQNQETIVYLHFKGIFSKQFPLTIAEETRFFKEAMIEDSITIAVVSALLALAVYNLFLYFSIWEKYYRTYALLIFTFIVALISFKGFLPYFLPETPRLNIDLSLV